MIKVFENGYKKIKENNSIGWFGDLVGLGLGWSLRICICNVSLSDIVVGSGIVFWELLGYRLIFFIVVGRCFFMDVRYSYFFKAVIR